MPVDRDTPRPLGFAFVDMSSDEDVARAIERFDGTEVGGWLAESQPGGTQGSGAAETTET